MPYCTIDDLKARIPESELVQLTDDAGLEVLAQGVVDGAIRQADDLIDGYLRASYVVPLAAPLPNLVTNISSDLALFHLYSRRFQGQPDGIPEAITKRYDDARADLARIQRGALTLDVAAQPNAGGGLFLCNKTDEDRDFSDEVFDQF